MRGMASGGKLLILANRARVKPETASPFDLWLVAKEETADVYSARVHATRHAFIHAGYIKAADGQPYTQCPDCDEALPELAAAAAA